MSHRSITLKAVAKNTVRAIKNNTYNLYGRFTSCTQLHQEKQVFLFVQSNLKVIGMFPVVLQ